MATKIKLQVNHGKHAKQESGQKISIKNQSKQQQSKQTQQKKQQNNKDNPQLQKSTDLQKSPQKNKSPSKNQKPTANPTQQQKPGKNGAKQSPSKQQKQQKSPQKQNKIDKQLQTIKRIKDTENKTKFTIQELINQYKNSAQDLFSHHGHNQQKQRVIAKKLQQLHNEKQQRHKKISSLNQKSLKKQSLLQKQQQELELKVSLDQKSKKQKKAQKKLQLLASLSQQRLEREQNYQNYINNEYKQKVFRYQKYQKQFKQKQKQYEQEIKEKLAKNKMKYLPMKVQDIQDFVQQYEHHKWNMIEETQRKKREAEELLERENREWMSKLWKGQCHNRVKEERKERLDAKNQGRTKLEKTKEYGTIVKDSFKPKINKEKRNNSLTLSSVFKGDETQVIGGKQFKKVARQKYQNGVNKGLILENLRQSLQHTQKVKIGNQYLDFIRSLPKAKKPSSPSPQVLPDLNQNPEKIKKPPTFRPKILKNPYYSPGSDRVGSKSAALDEKRLKDPQLFHYAMADLRARSRQIQLQEKAIKHGRYNDVLQLQEKHNNLNMKMIRGISQKLNILGRM